ncbi:diacylglycerol kinase [Massilia glaciei]|uniref:Diacylglycerol kinase n=1 Tax=Massilia glaciei TaxID=1524097 RepID=A0A2U2HHS8_9BURK|nr:diacylglycerol kinase [Massilia glaciei]PWF45480.1 diacylglycerol kinase [Massilia glaciei]
MKNQSFSKRLGFAMNGVAAAWRAEASFRTQCAGALAVVVVLLWRRPEPVWWALLLLNCALVLGAELFNSALEHALDRVHPEHHPAIGIAKDCAAGAVLVLSLAAVCVFIAFVVASFG